MKQIRQLTKNLAIAFSILSLFLLVLIFSEIVPYYYFSIVKIFFYLVLLITTFFLILIIREIKEDEREKSNLVQFISYMFILSLFILGLNQFIHRQIISGNQLEVLMLSICLGFIVFCSFKKRIEKDIELKKINEELSKKKRIDSFVKKNPNLNRIKVIATISKFIYSESWAILGLLIIIIIFTMIKYPYFDLSFTGHHPIKYSAYVEPALHMAIANNPFLNQRGYFIKPLIDNSSGKFSTFSNLPLLEWGLFTFYKIFSHNSIEFNTRLFTNFIGLIILILIYIFLKFYLDKRSSLVTTLIIALNPIFSFSTYVTITDSVSILFMFLSLIKLNSYINNKDIKDLFISGIFLGIGNAIKLSLGLWTVPIFALILFRESEKKEVFRNLIFVCLLSILPIIAVKTSITYLPSYPIIGILGLFLWLLFFFVIYSHCAYLLGIIDKISKFILLERYRQIVFLIILPALSYMFIIFTGLNVYFKEFLFDIDTLFNFKIYYYVLYTQLTNYITFPIYLISIIGIILIFYSNNEKYKTVAFSFLFGSLVYLVSASKVIIFHNYYTLIIIFSFLIFASFSINLASNLFKKEYLNFLVVVLLFISIFALNYNLTKSLLSKEYDRDVVEAGHYFRSILKEEEIILRPGNINDGSSVISIYSLKSSFPADHLADFNISSDTLNNHNINYLFIYQESDLDYINNVLNCENLSFIKEQTSRESLIYYRVRGLSYPSHKISCPIKYDIKEHIQLIKKIGKISIYSIDG